MLCRLYNEKTKKKITERGRPVEKKVFVLDVIPK
jgi:hypothetical protein